MHHLVMGITAHVDSGKTTLAEAMLYKAGEIRKLGRVDHGDAFLDSDAMERARGITIFSHQAQMRLGDTEITLLDTPGHVDFSAETERVMQVLDAAVLVISGTDGVQSHTETLWKLLEHYEVPVFLFVNKMDLNGAEREQVLAELQSRLGEGCLDFSDVTDPAFLEAAAMCEEPLMEEFLENGEISTDALRRSIARRKLFPCYFGSALKLEGVTGFLQGLECYTTPPSYGDAFAAQVFKISSDEKGSRLTHLKITGGALHVRDAISYTTESGTVCTEKVSQIRCYSGTKFQTVETIPAGAVCTVTGLSRTFCGQGLGASENSTHPVLEPVMSYALQFPAGTNLHAALQKLLPLEEEEPSLHLVWNESLQEVQVQLMGAVQKEILEQRIAQRFDLSVTFGSGRIAYRETIRRPVEGVGHYEPLRHYAEVHLLLEPLPQGSGLQFAADCREDTLDKNWQNLVLTHLAEKIHVGVLTGSPITDMRITLRAGKAHVKHTEGGDFRQATYRAVRNGLRKAESVLLEPWYAYTLEVPQDCVGRAMADIQQCGGTFQPPETKGDTAVLRGKAPVAGLQDYYTAVTNYTHGKGRLFCTQAGYAPCENSAEIIDAIGYDCDGDVENSADSVFCGNGAAYVVRWDEVEQHMHLPSCLEAPKEAPPESAAPAPSAVRRYGGSLEEDQELMAIFERTYGKVERDLNRAFRGAAELEQMSTTFSEIAPQQRGEEYLLVDGYNIIFAWDELKTLAQESLDTARSRLIQILCNYQGYRKCHLILVFDAYRVNGVQREIEHVHDIDVVYTKAAETADSYIEKTTRTLCREHRVRVATSDGMEQLIILGNGAYRISAEEFRQEVKQTEQAIRTYLDSADAKSEISEIRVRH